MEEDIKNIEKYISFTSKSENFSHDTDWNWNKDLANKIEHILSDYKRVLKENEMYKKNSEIMSKENLSTAEQLKVEIKENFRLKYQLENNRKEYQETYKDVREELKELKKENEELRNLIAHKNGYTKKLEEDLFENCNNYVVPIQKIKDKIEEEKLPLVIVGGRRNKKILEYGIKLGRRQALQELIEESK